MDLKARVEQVEIENLQLRTENRELIAKCEWFEEQLKNAEEHNRMIAKEYNRGTGNYENAFKLLVAELKGGQK